MQGFVYRGRGELELWPRKVDRKATLEREFRTPWRKAGPPNHHDDKVDLGK